VEAAWCCSFEGQQARRRQRWELSARAMLACEIFELGVRRLPLQLTLSKHGNCNASR
jgi:hypothetical protein